MTRRCYPKKPHQKRDFFKEFDDSINLFFDIIHEKNQIASIDLQRSLTLTPTKFYKIQRAGLQQFNKTITYDKKKQVFSYTPFIPTINKLEEEIKISS